VAVHIYTQIIHRTTQITTNVEERGPCPVFASFTLEFVLQLRKKHGKTSVRLRKTSVKLRKTSVRLHYTYVQALLVSAFNHLNAKLNPICCLLALLGAHHFLHVSRIRVKKHAVYRYGSHPIIRTTK